MFLQAGCDKAPQLIQDVRQCDQKRCHERHLERHKKRGGDVSGNHLPTLGQSGEQWPREQCIEICCPGKQAMNATSNVMTDLRCKSFAILLRQCPNPVIDPSSLKSDVTSLTRWIPKRVADNSAECPNMTILIDGITATDE